MHLEGGCGAMWGDTSIAVKELVPIIIAVAIWGHMWRGNIMLCDCDNQWCWQYEGAIVKIHLWCRCYSESSFCRQFDVTLPTCQGWKMDWQIACQEIS